jgi:hypothetical protein
MHLLIDDNWRARLLRIREGQSVAPEIEALLGCTAIFLYGRLGNSAYLGLDGRMVGWGAAEWLPPAVVEDPAEVIRVIVLGAHQLGILELVELLPPAPPNSGVCPMCKGQRWDSTPNEWFPDGGICLGCRGRGWVAPWPPRKDAEQDAAADRGHDSGSAQP